VSRPNTGLIVTRMIEGLRAERQAHLDAAGKIEAAFHRIGIACDSCGGSAHMPARLPVSQMLAKITPAERHVLRLLRAGRTEAQVGTAIGRSPHTVHVHVRNLYRKLNVNSRRELLDLFES
jgi:DNA-binding CsgD family transcriptional regulator